MIKAFICLIRKDYKVEILVKRLKSIDSKLDFETDNYQRMILFNERENILKALKKLY